jgi:hypothetical protein
VVDVLWGLGGMLVLLGIAVAISSNRRPEPREPDVWACVAD